MSQVLQRFGGEGMIEAGRGADVQNPHVLHPPPRRPTSESEYSEAQVVHALSAAGPKSRMREQMRHDSAVIRWIRVAVALVLVLALSASVYWGYTLFLLATGLIVFGVAYGRSEERRVGREGRGGGRPDSDRQGDCGERSR